MFARMLDCHEDSSPPWLEDACAIGKACTVESVVTNHFWCAGCIRIFRTCNKF